MARPPALSADEKTRIVLDILSGRSTLVEAARRAGVSTQSLSNWKRQFLNGGRRGLEGRDRAASDRERRLRKEVAELKRALGDAYMQIRLLRPSRGRPAVPPHPAVNTTTAGRGLAQNLRR